MKLFALLSFVGLALAVPKGYSNAGGGSQEQCTCLESSQELGPDGTIRGFYTYVDPVGSTIRVTYTHGQEGYSEKRKITKAKGIKFTAFKDQAPATGVKVVNTQTTTTTTTSTSFSTSVSQLSPLVGQSVSFAVSQFGVLPLGQIADQIEADMYPEVLRAVTFYLKEKRETGLDAESIADRVVRQVSTLITDSVKAFFDSDRIAFPGNVDEEDIVRRVVGSIVVVVREAIETERQSITFPVVPAEVTMIKEKVVSKPIVTDVITTVEENTQVQEGSTRPSSEEIIAQVLKAIKPVIAQAVRDHSKKTVTTSKVTTTSNKQTSRPVRPSQPQRPAPQKVTTTTEEFSKDLVTDLVLQLQPVIGSEVKTVFSSSAWTQMSNAQLADQIVNGMTAQIRSVIARTTQGDASYTEAKIDRLHQRLVSAIRPVILQTLTAFRKAQEQQIESQVLSPDFVQGIVDQIIRYIQESRVIETVIRQNPGAQQSRLITLIIEELNVNGYAKDSISSSGITVPQDFYTSAAYQKLMTKIREALQRVVEEFIAEYRQAQAAQVESQVLSQGFAEGIAQQLVPSFQATIQSVVDSNPNSNDNEIVQLIIQQLNLRGAIQGYITSQGVAVSNDFYSSQTYNTLLGNVRQILVRLLPRYIAEYYQTLTRQAESQVLAQGFADGIVQELIPSFQVTIKTAVNNNPSSNDNEIVQLIIQQLNLRNAIQGYITRQGIAVSTNFYSSQTYNTLLANVRQILVRLLPRYIAEYRQTLTRQAESQVLAPAFVQTIVDNALANIDVTIHTVLTSQNSGNVADSRLMELILQQLNLRGFIQNAISTSGISVSSGFYTSETYRTLLSRVETSLLRLLPQYVAVVRQTQSQIIRTVSDSMQSSLRPTVTNILESYATTSDEEIYEEVISVLRLSILQNLRTTFQGNAAYRVMSGSEDWFYAQIVAELRVQIIQLIRTIQNEIRQQQQQQVVIQQQQQVVQQQQQVQVQQTGGQTALTSIFGVSGGPNKVSVETPGYKYAYEHRK